MNIEQARFNMIEQQIRPWEVLDPEVLELLAVVKREQFVPPAYRNLAFADLEVPLPNGQHMLSPKIEARMLQELAVRKHESVLEIGTGSGYMAALLGARAQQVLSIELDSELAEFARENLRDNAITNVTIDVGNGAQGWASAAPYDVIVLSGGLPILPQSLLEQLKPGGRLAAFIGDAPVMKAQIVTRMSATEYRIVDIFETWVTPFEHATQPSRFTF